MYNVLQNYALSSALSSYALISSLSSYVTSSSLTTTLSSYALSSALSSYVTSSSLTTTLSSYLTSSISSVNEQIYYSGTGTNLSLSYSSIKGVVYYSPSANFTLTLTNVPTTSTNASYTITFIYNTLFYCNAITVNGTSYTMRASGGLANVSVSASSNFVMQTISIVFLNSATPNVLTNVASLY